jgi:hypothetical protein
MASFSGHAAIPQTPREHGIGVALLAMLAKPDSAVSSSAITLLTSVAGMTNLSIRGLDDKALAALKRRAAREDASVNTLVVRLIEQGLGLRRAKPSLVRHDDLDALAGTWREQDVSAFERATAPFAKVDAELWK